MPLRVLLCMMLLHTAGSIDFASSHSLRLDLANVTPSVAHEYVLDQPPPPIRNVNHLVYHKGFVYVGAENWLLKLNAATLRIEQSVQYGPLLDSIYCRHFPVEECSFEKQPGEPTSAKQLSNNYNKLLIVHEKQQALLSCWSARQGVCDLRDLNDLSLLRQSSAVPAVANDPVNSTVGFIASGANSQDLLYVAATYNDQGPYRGDLPALAGRSLHPQVKPRYGSSPPRHFMQILASSQGLKSSKASIEFIARFQKSFIVKYVSAFNLGVYNYFLTVQHMDTDALARGALLTTKLARLCLNDLSFTKSYTEMPLKCSGGVRADAVSYSLRAPDYNELISARLVRLADSEYYVAGLFQQTGRVTFNASLEQSVEQAASIRQAVCLFPLRLLQEKVKENLNNCYNSEQTDGYEATMRGLSFIKPDQRCSSSSRSRLSTHSIGDDFCSSADNGLYPIGGQLPATAQAVIELDSAQTKAYYDSLQVSSDSTATSIVLLASKQQQVKFFHLSQPQQQAQLYRTVQLGEGDARGLLTPATNLELETGHHSPPNLLVAANNRIHKLKMSACESFKTCGECLTDSDPFCGWCSLSGECTTRQECTSADGADMKWLHVAQTKSLLSNESLTAAFDSLCVDVVSVEPAIATLKSEAQWIQVNFRKELTTSSSQVNATDLQCVFSAGSGEMSTDAFQIAPNKLKCSMPHSTRLRQVFAETPVGAHSMSIGEDGIFMQVATDSAYNEPSASRIVLPLHVKSLSNKNVRYGATRQGSVAFNLTVLDCGAYKSCISCLGQQQCGWCGHKCVPVTSQDTCHLPGQCSSFDTGTNKLLIPFTAHRQQAPLTFSLANLNEPGVHLECMLTMFNGQFVGKNVSLPFALINSTHGHCNLVNVFKSLSFIIDASNNTAGQVQTNLRLYDRDKDLFIDSASNGRLALLFYRCEIKAGDCSQCLSLNRQFSCMWCGGSGLAKGGEPTCRFMNAQSKQAAAAQCISAVSTFFSAAMPNRNARVGFNQCDKPQISSIEPTKLPIGGGTLIVISGVNLGSAIDDLSGVFIQCGTSGESVSESVVSNIETVSSVTKCDLVADKYVPSKQIVCRTKPSTGGVQRSCKLSVQLRSRLVLENELATEGSLMNILISNSQTIEYVDPVISGIEPATVIQSANFVWLTIKGLDLDAGRTRHIEIVDYGLAGHDSYASYDEQTAVLAGMGTRLLNCDIKNVTSTELKCRLNDKFRSRGRKDLKITFDNAMSIMHSGALTVTADPMLAVVNKKLSIYAGGTLFNLSGFNFDAVQSAYTYIVFR